MEELVGADRLTKEPLASMPRARHITVFAATPASVGGDDASILLWWRRQRP